MEINEEAFEALIENTLRVELLNGKVIIYRIDTGNKKYLMNKLTYHSYGEEGKSPIQFVWFEINLQRTVLINMSSVARITFCFDYIDHQINEGNAYYDNFKILHTDTYLEERKTEEGEVRLHVIEENTLPQAIIYHKGKAPDDLYDDNPITYSELNPCCLEGLYFELEGEVPLRQFINLIDDDGEANFIPFNQVMIMELDTNLIYEEEDMDELDEAWDFEGLEEETGNMEENEKEEENESSRDDEINRE